MVRHLPLRQTMNPGVRGLISELERWIVSEWPPIRKCLFVSYNFFNIQHLFAALGVLGAQTVTTERSGPERLAIRVLRSADFALRSTDGELVRCLSTEVRPTTDRE